MKKLLLLSLFVLSSGLGWCDTSTTRAGIVKPSYQKPRWDLDLNANFDIIDTSACFQGVPNTFTSSNTFRSTLGMKSSSQVDFYDTADNQAGSIVNNCGSGGNNLWMVAPDGVAINGNEGPCALAATADLMVYGGTASGGPGRFVVVGSSADASTAYSGFKASPSISQSMLWTLPQADGTSGQAITTDGLGNLSFRTISGGGSGSGSVSASTQGNVGYYSGSATNTISGVTQGTTGQILTTGGSTGPPFWSSNLPSGASNYVRNTETLQSGATFYVSSGTIGSGNFYINSNPALAVAPFPSTGTLILNAPSQTTTNGSINYNVTSGAIIPKFSLTVSSGPVTSGNALSMIIDGSGSTITSGVGSCNQGLSYGGVCLSQSTNNGVSTLGSAGANNFTTLNWAIHTGSTSFNGNINVSSGVLLSGSAGTSGQVLTSGGSGAVPTWTTVSGGGNLASTQTWTGQNNWTTPAQSTFTYGVAVGSLTVSGSGNLSVTENGLTGQVVISTGVPTNGQLAVFGASHTVVASGFTNTLLAVNGSGVLISTTVSGGGGGGATNGTVNSSTPSNVAFYTGTTTVSGSSIFNLTGASATVQSSFTLNTGGGGATTDNTAPGLFNIFSGLNTAYDGQPLLVLGNKDRQDQVVFPARQPALLNNYGANIGDLAVGYAANLNRIGTINSSNNYIDIYNADDAARPITIRTGALDNRDIVLVPQTVETVRLSSGAMTVQSSVTINAATAINGAITANGTETITYGNSLQFQDSNGVAGAYLSNPNGLGAKSLAITAPHGFGIGINNPNIDGFVELFVLGGMQVQGSTQTTYQAIFSTSTTNPPPMYALAITTSNHVSSGGVLTSTSSCGTGAGFSGNDFSGFITPGAGASGCTITFGTTYTNLPTCVISERTVSLVNALSYTVTKTALTISQTSLSSIVDYICTGIRE